MSTDYQFLEDKPMPFLPRLDGVTKELSPEQKQKRDEFACAAMQGMCAGSQKYYPEEIARLAYTVADEMLKARDA